MKYRPLPFLEQINALLQAGKPEDAQAALQGAMLDVARQPGFQVILGAIQAVEAAALAALRSGTGDPQRLMGRLSAAEAIRSHILAHFPDRAQVAEAEPQEEFEISEIYDSGFNIPFPSGE